MSRNLTIKQWAGAALAVLISSGVVAAPTAQTGLLAFTPMQIQDSGGGPLEQGIFTYQNRNYDVRFDGLGVGGVKGSKVTISGEVYGLKDVADLEGDYVSELSTAPTTEVSSDDLWLYSDRGVSLHLRTDSSAATIATGGDKVRVQFGSAD